MLRPTRSANQGRLTNVVGSIDFVDLGDEAGCDALSVRLDGFDRRGQVVSLEIVVLELVQCGLELFVESTGGRLGERRRLAELLELLDCLFDVGLVRFLTDPEGRLWERGQVLRDEARVVTLRERVLGWRRLL